jgi:hypothetical protein
MTGMVRDAADLMALTQAELDDLYRQSPAGESPKGDTQGTVLFAPGTSFARPVAVYIWLSSWQGKVFDRRRPILENKITPIGIKTIPALVYYGSSWVDGRPCIVIDYSKTSLVACLTRDEIREVAPGLYLGVVFLGRIKILNFALSCPARTGAQNAVEPAA